MADLTLRAEEVVGGLWYRSPLYVEGAHRGPHGWTAMLWWSDEGRPVVRDGLVRISRHGDSPHVAPISACSLVLSDPRGLGLAGLAANVAERMEPANSPWLPEWLRVLLDGPTRWDDCDPEQLCKLSAGLALTDTLCALLGLELEPGEVASWRKTHDFRWVLECSAGKTAWSATYGVTGRYCPKLVDCGARPLEAARAAVAALEAEHGQ